MTAGPPSSLESSLGGLPGIGPAREQAYAAAGLVTRRDLLYHLPVRYRVRPDPVTVKDLTDGARAALVGRVRRASLRRRGRNSTVSVLLADDAGEEALVLIFNRAYLAKAFGRGTRLWAAGKVERSDEGRPRLLAADYEVLDDDADGPRAPLVPVYRLPAGVPPRVHRKALATILELHPVPDWRVPLEGEPGLHDALAAVHLADDLDAARAARVRLARDEALALSLDAAARRGRVPRVRTGAALEIDDALHARLLGWLPHVPTAAQARVLGELRRDLRAADDGRPMARLLQGDVGSGKTLVAEYVLLAALALGRQAAIMAPTEILARQHHAALERRVRAALGDGAPPVALVVGGMPSGERSAQRALVADGRARLAVGTHGLQSRSLVFSDLAVTVVDEQHRFGVRQRSRFRMQGDDTHLLVMTATPIPRTLALTAYGELDVSILDELPPGRAPRRTVYVQRGRQDALWERLATLVADGERGYVVCPSIRGVDESERHSVEAMHATVRARLGDGARVGAVHGRMPPAERDAVLDAFRAGALDVLVATVLVEVGLDVPEATFVVVPDPSRFGLATLHQIRGRVGRGLRAGACYLLGPVAGPARERVRALVDCDDGFALAEEDLRLRGPGELLGTRQSGLPGFLVLDPVRDVELLATTREVVRALAAGESPEALERLRAAAFPRVRLVPENLLAGG
ncbi:MAG: ATP-dependent DNA helicase RecG [Planctomycetes bacterium]|nr:ATP-dependent DNA helicase RecG [Planctomycetota bacterium]